MIRAAVPAQTAQQTFPTLPPARAAHLTPHTPAGQQKPGRDQAGEEPGETGQGNLEGGRLAMDRRDKTCFPGVEGMRPQVPETPNPTDGECSGWHRKAQGLEGVRVRCSPYLALHSWEHRPQRKRRGWSPGNILERVKATFLTFCPRRGPRPTPARAASQAH